MLLLAAGLMQSGDVSAPPKLKKAPPAAASTKDQEPPEEDEALATKEYAFNPVQAAKEIRTGDFYLKKGKYKAAAARYLEATRWNNQSAEAFWKLGEAQEKQEEPQLAKDAFQQALALNPNAKETAAIKKHLEKLQ
jgi:tetratricopeptide (TPR) repeat protein